MKEKIVLVEFSRVRRIGDCCYIFPLSFYMDDGRFLCTDA